MLQAMRDGSKGTVAKIIVGLIIMTFALFGIDSIVALGGGTDAPAEVNGEKVTELRVAQMIDLQKRRLQSQFGDSFQLEDARLRSIAVDGLINEVVLKQAAKDAGASFSDAEIDKLILQSPEFQVAGAFDRNQFDLVLRSAGFTRSSYRELLRTNLLIQQAQSAWQASAFATPLESNTVSKLDLQSRDFSTITYSFSKIKDSINISDDEARTFFNDNSSNYMTDESVIVDYIELKRTNLISGVQIDEADIEARYQDILVDGKSKKEFRASHILLTSTDNEAKDKLSSALNKINEGADFASLAKELSDDDSSKYAGGDLGFATLEIYEPEFSEALQGLAVGQTSEVIQTRDGLHIIKLLEERSPEVASFDSLKGSIEKSLAEEAAQMAYVDALEALKDEAFSSGSLADVAKTLGLTVKTTAEFTRAGGKGIASNKSIVELAFSEAVLSDGTNSEVIEISDGQAIVVHLNKFKESVVKPFDEVKAQVVALLQNQAAREALSTTSTEALVAAKEGTLNAKWVSIKDKRRTTEGLDAAVLKAAFALSEGSYELVEVAGGDQVLVRLDSISRPEVAANESDSDQKVSRSKAYNEYKAYQQFVTELSDIERN